MAMSYQPSTGFSDEMRANGNRQPTRHAILKNQNAFDEESVANWAYLKIRASAIVAFSHVSYTRKEIDPLLHPTPHASHHLTESSFIRGIREFTIIQGYNIQPRQVLVFGSTQEQTHNFR
ncbi:hypothetical protein G5I_11142 [Acromyrmex echinatior]|uniref:Uncharacterized protein n=1 Tax=Acromyrmex echinatior TaxID=103372 RepID=F4WYS8_ACREC|nr:hypothetical protein G5I_11142 [Acromyrmex echinatior]